MHGCGVRIWKDPDTGKVNAAEGKFFADEFVGPVMSCGPQAARDAALEADVAASMARSLMVGARGRGSLDLGTGVGLAHVLCHLPRSTCWLFAPSWQAYGAWFVI